MGIWLRGKSWYYDFQVKGKRYVGRIGPVSKTIAKEVAARKKSEAYQGLLGIKTAIKDPLFEPFCPKLFRALSPDSSSFLSSELSVSYQAFCPGVRQAAIIRDLTEGYRAVQSESACRR